MENRPPSRRAFFFLWLLLLDGVAEVLTEEWSSRNSWIEKAENKIQVISGGAERYYNYHDDAVYQTNMLPKNSANIHHQQQPSGRELAVTAYGGEDYDQSLLLQPIKLLGDESCPCLTASELDSMMAYRHQNFSKPNNNNDDYEYPEYYGLECRHHDVDASYCSSEAISECIRQFPLPEDCNKAWCRRPWCWVNPQKCNNKPNTASTRWTGLYYSYSTCGYLDQYTSADRHKSLQNKTYKVGFNSNTGGWTGAYNPEGHFALNKEWDGPLVRFVRDSALQGDFTFQMTQPPDWIVPASRAFFGKSSFDLCVYATALGYLDLCVSAYTITSKRASITPFFELATDPVYLVTFTSTATNDSALKEFSSQVMTIFLPFHYTTWIVVIWVFLPVLGLLMLYHERDSPGSVFPNKHQVQIMRRIKQPATETESTITWSSGSLRGNKAKTILVPGPQKEEPIPLWMQIIRALYMMWLSLVSGTYEAGIVTVGGKIHLLAIFSFLTLILTVYTANLAAILTSHKRHGTVESIKEALEAGHNFCAERRVGNSLIKLYNLDPNRLVVDPLEEGGDGMPGFNCPNCAARQRAVDFMKFGHNDPSLYCDAAFVSHQDLQVLHSFGHHCNKTIVGSVLLNKAWGMPIYEGSFPELSSWFYKMKYEGLLSKLMIEAEPNSQCPDETGADQEEGVGLTIKQLTGIWFIVVAFVLAGLVARKIYYHSEHNLTPGGKSVQVRKLYRHDQWENPIQNPLVQLPPKTAPLPPAFKDKLQHHQEECGRTVSENSFKENNDLCLSKNSDRPEEQHPDSGRQPAKEGRELLLQEDQQSARISSVFRRRRSDSELHSLTWC